MTSPAVNPVVACASTALPAANVIEGAFRVMLPEAPVELPTWWELTSVGLATERLEITLPAATLMLVVASSRMSAPFTVMPDPDA